MLVQMPRSRVVEQKYISDKYFGAAHLSFSPEPQKAALDVLVFLACTAPRGEATMTLDPEQAAEKVFIPCREPGAILKDGPLSNHPRSRHSLRGRALRAHGTSLHGERKSAECQIPAYHA